jgi:protease-4
VAAASRGIAGLCAVLALCGCFNRVDVDLGLLDVTGELSETVVLGEAGPKLALVDVTGVISERPRTGALGLLAGPSMVSELREVLERAGEDPEVRGLIVRVESPGGSVTATETLHHELALWREEQERPVIAYLNGIAASGGYYVAMAADLVLAHPAAVTGSIGVVMPSLGFAGLMERYGVSNQTVKSGEYKDVGSPVRPMTAADRAHLQSVVDDLHARFVEVVDAGRPGLDRAQASALADGRLFTARQALEAKLIDAIGYMEDAVAAAEDRAGLEQSRVVMYARPGRPRENIHSRYASPEPPRASLDPSFAAGFYYLWPAALGE